MRKFLNTMALSVLMLGLGITASACLECENSHPRFTAEVNKIYDLIRYEDHCSGIMEEFTAYYNENQAAFEAALHEYETARYNCSFLELSGTLRKFEYIENKLTQCQQNYNNSFADEIAFVAIMVAIVYLDGWRKALKDAEDLHDLGSGGDDDD